MVGEKVVIQAGALVTFTVYVLWHPVLEVNVIVAVPVETPVTTPELLTVATPVFEEVHGFDAAGVPTPVNEIVDPAQTEFGPEIEHPETEQSQPAEGETETETLQSEPLSPSTAIKIGWFAVTETVKD